MTTLKCGPLTLKPGDGRIMEWTPEGKEYPCIHILDGGGFLYLTRRHSPGLLTDDETCQRSDQHTADALYLAILDSEIPSVVRFREEWMR